MMRSITLVATPERLRIDFPKQFRPLAPGTNPGLACAAYEVDPAACATALGRWLAETVTTTLFDDAASVCTIVLPQTEEGHRVRELADALMQRQPIADLAEAEALFADIEAWLAVRRAAVKESGPDAFRHRVIRYKWPVFGSAAAENTSSPESYFDICAKQMRATGGVIVDVGSVALPDALAKTMAPRNGGGDRLLQRYRQHAAADSVVA